MDKKGLAFVIGLVGAIIATPAVFILSMFADSQSSLAAVARQGFQLGVFGFLVFFVIFYLLAKIVLLFIKFKPNLWVAAESGDLATVKTLLDSGIDVNATTDKSKLTALIKATINGHLEVVRYLLNKDADINAKSATGWTAMIAASATGRTEIVKLLLGKEGIEINTKTNNGKAALTFAKNEKHNDIVELLKNAGAKE